MQARLFKNHAHIDSRGRFQRLFDYETYDGEVIELRQVSISDNPQIYTLRGMHFQVSGRPENKFISVLRGEISLVVSNAHLVDKKSDIRNQNFFLTEHDKSTLLVPSGLATGWLSLSSNVLISYLMTARFEECSYSGFCYNDKFANIEWPLSPLIVSDKDRSWPPLI